MFDHKLGRDGPDDDDVIESAQDGYIIGVQFHIYPTVRTPS